MAHTTKLKMGAVAPMLNHYERRFDGTLERENIDASRTRMNYTVGEVWDIREDIAERVEVHNANGRALRADAVPMADTVITLPEGFPIEWSRDFFGSVHDFFIDRYGAENVPQGYVHLDESRPHMHQPIVCWDADAGRFRAREIINRADLKTLHQDMERWVCRELGMERVGLMLDREDTARKLSRMDLPEYQRAKDEIKQAKAEQERVSERLEYLQGRAQEVDRGNRELEAACDEYRERVERLEGERAAYEQDQAIGHEVLAFAQRVGERAQEGAEPLGDREQREAARGRDLDERLERARAEAEERVGELRERIGRVESEIQEAQERYAQRVEKDQAKLQEARAEQQRLRERNSELKQQLGVARERLSRALDRAHEKLSPQRFREAVSQARISIRDVGEKLYGRIVAHGIVPKGLTREQAKGMTYDQAVALRMRQSSGQSAERVYSLDGKRQDAAAARDALSYERQGHRVGRDMGLGR